MTDHPVLIAYDGSDEARRAIETAARLLGGRRAIVLDVGPVFTVAQSIAASADAVVMPEFEDENLSAAQSRAAEGADVARAAGFDAEPRSDIRETVWEGIVACADSIDASVIVLGSHGRGGAGEFLHGSISHQVSVNAGRPVLIVPPPKGDHRS